MSYPIADIDDIGPDEVLMLKRIGIRTTSRLLDAAKSPKDRKKLAARTGIAEKRLLKWANSADRMRIKGVGDDYAELIHAAGVEDRARSQAPQCQAADRSHGEGEQAAQAGQLPPLREGGAALDRARQEAAAQDQLSIEHDPIKSLPPT